MQKHKMGSSLVYFISHGANIYIAPYTNTLRKKKQRILHEIALHKPLLPAACSAFASAANSQISSPLNGVYIKINNQQQLHE